MQHLSALTFISLFLSYTPATVAYWRMACSVSQTSRIDPILNPGSVSGHVHKFAGGNNVNQDSTQASLLASTCSTCEVQSDKSAYWTPQLYYQNGNGTIEEVQNEGMTVYYVGRGGNASNTVPFPEGFKMISGDSTVRHYDSQNLTYMNTRPIADRVSFRCIDAANNLLETHYLNDTNCVNGLRAQLNFQSCWDGTNLYLPGNKHVAYLSGIDYGVCPPTHPVPIPGLFFEVLYWTNRVNQQDGGRFVFSNGDTTGFGFHGDFLNGWDQAVQERAVQQCLYVDDGGRVSACPTLAPSVDENFSRNCPESPSVLPEAVKGILPRDQLPGCNPITSGPADAPQIVCAINATTTISPQTSQQTTSAAPYANSTVTVTLSGQNNTVTQISSATSTQVASSYSTDTSPFANSQTPSQTAGGIFVTVSSSATTPAPATVTVTDTITVRVTHTTITNQTLSSQPWSNSTATGYTGALNMTTTTMTVTTDNSYIPIQTTFVTLYSGTSVTEAETTYTTFEETAGAKEKRHNRYNFANRLRRRETVQ